MAGIFIVFAAGIGLGLLCLVFEFCVAASSDALRDETEQVRALSLLGGTSHSRRACACVGRSRVREPTQAASRAVWTGSTTSNHQVLFHLLRLSSKISNSLCGLFADGDFVQTEKKSLRQKLWHQEKFRAVNSKRGNIFCCRGREGRVTI